MDVERDHLNGTGWFSDDPEEIVQRFGSVWKTADFKAGDVLIFSMRYCLMCAIFMCFNMLVYACVCVCVSNGFCHCILHVHFFHSPELFTCPQPTQAAWHASAATQGTFEKSSSPTHSTHSTHFTQLAHSLTHSPTHSRTQFPFPFLPSAADGSQRAIQPTSAMWEI